MTMMEFITLLRDKGQYLGNNDRPTENRASEAYVVHGDTARAVSFSFDLVGGRPEFIKLGGSFAAVLKDHDPRLDTWATWIS
jgi:hypothetical protein